MSTNNNPHGQLNQAQAQNTSWNPLQQIPSYIPRQPQLAHMSNERHMVRSPLAWHGPPAAPPETLYNFMSANHKNLEHQMNPLLPPYVRNSTIFDSMDLSLQSARATTSPLNKGGVMGMPIAPQLDFGIKATTTTTTTEQSEHTLLQQQSLQLHSQSGNNYPIHNLSMSSNSPQQQQIMSANTASTNSPNMQTNVGKYLNANGANDCESSSSSSMLPPINTNVSTTATTTITNVNNNGNSKTNNNNNNNNNSNSSSGGPSPVHYTRSDADLVPRLNEHFAKMNEMRRMSFDGEYPPKSVQKSEELASKECNYNKMMKPTPATPPQQQQQQQQFSPKKQSPNQGYQTPQQQKTPPQLSPYHNQGNSGKRNGPNTPPNRSPTAQQQQQQQSMLLQGNGGRPGGVGSAAPVMDYHQMQGNNFKPPQQQQQQQFLPSPHQQQHNVYQAQQQQNSSPPNSQLINRSNPACSQAPLNTSTDELKYNATRARSHSNSSSSSSSSDDDEDDDSVDSSNSSHSHHSHQKSIDKLNSNQAAIDIVKKDELDSKVNSPPPTNISQTGPTSPQLATSPITTSLVDAKEQSEPKSSNAAVQENGLSNKNAIDNSNESILNKNCDFSQQMLDSPKTKKQKQALKIRNAEQTNSNSNSSLNNDTKIETAKVNTTALSTNDNAVLADDLRKEQTDTVHLKAACYSPRSNSRSSHSSSSSSNCSHSSRSSNDSKSHKTELSDKKPEQSNDLVNLTENSIKAEKQMKSHKNEPDTVKNEVKTETTQNVLEKSNTFEEVENKLEEMFAGIEDEEPATATAQAPLIGAPIVADINLAMQLANNSPNIIENDAKATTKAASEDIKLPVPMATKASKKSTPTLQNTPALQYTNKSTESAELETKNNAKPAENNIAELLPGTSQKTVEKDITVDIKETTDREKKQTSKTTRRRGAKKMQTKNTATAVTNHKNAAIKTNAKQKQQQKSNRRRRNTSDEDDSNSIKDPTNSAAAATDVKYRSPFVLVKRDGSVTVINAPTAEEAGSEKLGGKNKKIPAAKYAHERNRIRGMHSSTLSNKYDADTTDSTWICVFCKRGPHKEGLGDLFGPYLISTDCDEYRTALKLPGTIDVDAMFAAKRRRVDMVQTHPRNLPIVPAMHLKQQQSSPTSVNAGKAKKKRKSQSSNAEVSLNETKDNLNTSTSSAEILEPTNDVNIFLGMGQVSENSYEVWIHEDCTVWAPDVYLVGSRVTGLDATVWNSTRYNCEICAKPGATVCCLERDCKATAHAPCAKQNGWNLNEAQMKVHCRRHVEQKCKQMGMLSNALFFLNTVQTVNSYSDMPTP